MRGYYQSYFTDKNTNAETEGISMLKVTQQATEWSSFRDHEFNHHETHGYTDTETCLHQYKTSIRKKIGSIQLFEFVCQFLCKAYKPLKN